MNRPKKKNHTQLYKLMQKNCLKSSISFHEKKKKKKTPSKVEIEDKLFKLLTSVYKNKQKKKHIQYHNGERWLQYKSEQKT